MKQIYGGKMIGDLFSYFQKTGDDRISVFLVKDSPNHDAPYNGSVEFKHGKHRICILDQFNGKRPYYLNNQTCFPGEFHFHFYPSVIMDSHIASHLDRYYKQNTNVPNDIMKCTHDFLVHLTKTGFDFNPIFYVIESYHKNSLWDFWVNTPPVVESILKLQSIDTNTFLKDSSIRLDEKLTQELFDKYNADSFNECSQKLILKISEHPQSQSSLDVTYLCLLKMVLIKHKDKKGPYKKLDEFDKFMRNDIGLILAHEQHLALFYFSNLAGKLVNIQQNMNKSDAITSLRATAWDLFLLRLPMDVLSTRSLPEISLGYVATSENKLTEFGKHVLIDAKFCHEPTDKPDQPVFNYNLHSIQDVIGEKATLKIKKQNRIAVGDRAKQDPPQLISSYKMRCLKEDLETQLSNFCRG